jgi:hypothetical protein
MNQADLDRYVGQMLRSGRRTYWILSYESFYPDPHDAFFRKLASVGQLSEVPLPPDPEATAEEGSGMRLLRFSPRSPAPASNPIKRVKFALHK